MLPYDFGVAGRRPQLEIMLKVVDGGGVILLLLFVEEAGFEMGQSGMRIGFERLFETFKGTFIVKGVDTTLAGQKVGILFLVQLAATGRETARKSQPED